MAKLSAKEKYEKLQIKRIELMDKIEKLKTELASVNGKLEYAEFLAWKEEKKQTGNRIVVACGVAADAESDNKIMKDAAAGDEGGEERSGQDISVQSGC